MGIAAAVKVLPDHMFNTSYPVVMQQAAIESFYVNVRTLIEFLGVRPAKGDVSAADTLPLGWTPTLSQPERAELLRHWDDASKHLVHFSKLRTTVTVDTEEPAIRRMADNVLAVWDQFAVASAHGLVPLRADLTLYG